VVPGGSAASSALGYRLMTVSGVPGPDAGFALGTAGLGSAVVLNLIFWVGLIISIPFNGVNKAYVTAAIAGVLIMGLAAAIVFGLMEGQVRAEKVLRWIARHLRQDEDRTGDAVRHIGGRIEELISDRAMLTRVVGWAAANWLLDAASLWVFLRAYGQSLSVDGLIVAFGLANIAAVVPITPGGLGIVEGVYVPTLVGFGLTRRRVLPAGPAVLPHPARRVLVPDAAHRPVEDRTAQPVETSARRRRGHHQPDREPARVPRALRTTPPEERRVA
jgi:uncharacterized protein (TIRG00374 family)